jgi:hypothetical protein
MFAPGQNRADDSSNLSAGESDCAGGNDPTSGANPLVSCSDGAFSNAVSANLSYTNGPLYITGAYEFHQNVNRSSDLAGAYGVPIVLGAQDCSAFLAVGASGALSQQQCLEDTANEDAMKLGIRPLQAAHLRGPQTVPEGNQKHGGVPLAPAVALGGLDQLLMCAQHSSPPRRWLDAWRQTVSKAR